MDSSAYVRALERNFYGKAWHRQEEKWYFSIVAEPFKQWLAMVGKERQTERLFRKWIEQRLHAIDVRRSVISPLNAQ